MPISSFARRVVLSALAVLGAGALPVDAQPPEQLRFLPFMAPSMEAARYMPADADFAWVGWLGATVDLLEKGRWSGYFTPNIETILGHRVRSFEAVQANYSLEVGARREVGRGHVVPFFHHVSRHVQDRNKDQAIDWNFLGARYEAPWPEKWNRSGAWAASLGVATLSSGVGYNWEARVSGDVDLRRKGARALFVLADLRLVGAEISPGFDRGGFVDVRLEAGLRRWSDNDQSALFLAFEHRNDALIPESLVTSRALVGFRIRGQRRPAPATVPLP